MKKKGSLIYYVMATALLVVLLVCSFILFSIIKEKRNEKEIKLKYSIASEKEKYEKIRDFTPFINKEAENERKRVEVRDLDYSRFLSEEFAAVFSGMWNTDELDEEWYQTLWGEPIVFSDYEFRTPQELIEIINDACLSGSEIKKFFIGIDPVSLKEFYYNSVYYDEAAESFEEFVSDSLVNTIANYENIDFRIIFPIKPLTYWEKLGDEELDEEFDFWSSFAMLFHSLNNVSLVYSGDEEWLIANDNNFISEMQLTPEISKYMFVQNYSGYEILPPQVGEKRNEIKNLVSKKKNGDYPFTDLKDTAVTFFGDSSLAYSQKYTANIVSVISSFTGANCENMAHGGTLASSGTENSFLKVVDEYIKNDSDIYKDLQTHVFVVQFGLNDYFEGIAVDDDSDKNNVSTFGGAIRSGVELLREKYPDAKIILVAPYHIGEAEGGTIPYQGEGSTLADIASVINSISDEYATSVIDLFNDSSISYENSSEYLTDRVHPNFKTEFLLGQNYVKTISECCDENNN